MTMFAKSAVVAVAIATLLGAAGANAAPQKPLTRSCAKVGGTGNGVIEGFASFMSEAATKNQAKAWGGADVKITDMKTSCKTEGLVYCTSFARACK